MSKYKQTRDLLIGTNIFVFGEFAISDLNKESKLGSGSNDLAGYRHSPRQ